MIQARKPIRATISVAHRRIALPQSPIGLFSPNDLPSSLSTQQRVALRRIHSVDRHEFAVPVPASWLPSKLFSNVGRRNNHAHKTRRKILQVFRSRFEATFHRSQV